MKLKWQKKMDRCSGMNLGNGNVNHVLTNHILIYVVVLLKYDMQLN